MTEEKKDRYQVPIAQKVIFYDPKQNKFLLAKVKNKDGWYYKNLGPWEFPGGGFEEEETLSDSLKREIEEECGNFKYKVLGIINTNEYAEHVAFSGNKIVLIYLAEYLDGNIRMSQEHSEFRWSTFEEIENDSSNEYRDWIKSAIKKAHEYLERKNALDSWKRCQADFENYKKSQAQHQEEFRKYAKMDVIEQILPVLDNFEMSLAHVPEKSKENKWVEGIVYIKKQLEDVLRNNDIEEVEVKTGDKFNPEIHESVGGEGKKQKVAKVIQKGYRMNGRILRAARVEVS
jgi:molecular chaperone GrpE